VQRDLRQYIAKNSQRTIPVGYSAADVRPILQDTWAYLQCADNSTADQSRSEFFGLNSYSWCGATATYTTAGYDQLVTMFQNSSIPVFFSEYGCNKPTGIARPFNEVQALYGTQMTALSGGLVYEYSQEESDYGLVVLNANGSVSLRADYDNLQSQYNNARPL
jgi:1,3-beta-glucanosyltransferase GAS3